MPRKTNRKLPMIHSRRSIRIYLTMLKRMTDQESRHAMSFLRFGAQYPRHQANMFVTRLPFSEQNLFVSQRSFSDFSHAYRPYFICTGEGNILQRGHWSRRIVAISKMNGGDMDRDKHTWLETTIPTFLNISDNLKHQLLKSFPCENFYLIFRFRLSRKRPSSAEATSLKPAQIQEMVISEVTSYVWSYLQILIVCRIRCSLLHQTKAVHLNNSHVTPEISHLV
jgi:hypothetical protein